MKAIKSAAIILLTLCVAFPAFSQNGVWSVERAEKWYDDQGWLCGLNYIPANAINYTAMWDKTSFSPEVIDRELALAGELGLNCARVVLQYAVYEENPKHFLKAFDKFLEICDKHGIKVMPCFFDDCHFGANTDPWTGVQPEPLKGWYAWAWSPSPGHTRVIDPAYHPDLEKYVKAVMENHKNDSRILLWDLYNEPGLGGRSTPLVEKVFKWAREVDPSQPVSIGIWGGDEHLNKICAENSDIITFHCYATREHTGNFIKSLKAHGRPIICTEWMNRVAGSTIRDVLTLFLEENTGCMMWGLVNGKTQTELPWGHRPEMGEYTGPWQHDIYYGDFTPYDPEEIALLREYCKIP